MRCIHHISLKLQFIYLITLHILDNQGVAQVESFAVNVDKEDTGNINRIHQIPQGVFSESQFYAFVGSNTSQNNIYIIIYNYYNNSFRIYT